MKMCAPSLAEWLILQTNSGDTSSARKARRTVIKDEHRAKAAQRHEVYQERTNKQNDQLKTIKVMKRRNIYIASTLVLALVLMVGFPTSAKPQVLSSIFFRISCSVRVMWSIRQFWPKPYGGIMSINPIISISFIRRSKICAANSKRPEPRSKSKLCTVSVTN